MEEIDSPRIAMNPELIKKLEKRNQQFRTTTIVLLVLGILAILGAVSFAVLQKHNFFKINYNMAIKVSFATGIALTITSLIIGAYYWGRSSMIPDLLKTLVSDPD